jgi:hypothetical protein
MVFLLWFGSSDLGCFGRRRVVRADPSRERGGSLLHLELNLSVIWRKQVVEPNGRRGAHQNCHPPNAETRCH